MTDWQMVKFGFLFTCGACLGLSVAAIGVSFGVVLNRVIF